MKEDHHNLLVDTLKRRINYLRISITDRCNLRCVYCTPAQPFNRLAHRSILRYEEILRIAKVATGLGITKMRVTGGEPLVRNGCIDFLDRLREIPGIADLSLTTNGILLEKQLDRLARIGIRRLNISLDTLDACKYKKITGHDAFAHVWSAIRAALDKGFSPIKINVVAMSGINSDELEGLAALTFEFPFHVRFIERMPFSGLETDGSPPLLEEGIRLKLAPLGTLEPVHPDRNDGPAKRYRLEGAIGEIGFISAMSHHFCSACNRLRLTADGRLRGCLFSDAMIDIKTPLRSGASDDDIAALLIEAIRTKPSRHHLLTDPGSVRRKMYSIGG